MSRNLGLIPAYLRTAAVVVLLSGPAFGQNVSVAVVQNFDQTRSELGQLLERYPPKLGEVLRIDPSLLRNSEYLASYPELRAFLEKHPEVARDAESFFDSGTQSPITVVRQGQQGLGNVVLTNPMGGIFTKDFPLRSISNRTSFDAFRSVMDSLIVLVLLASALAVASWIVRAIADHRRWLRVSRLQLETHSKLMDRFTSNDDLLAYLKTPAGQRFLDQTSATGVFTAPSGAPTSRILWSVQLGLLMLFAGAAMSWVNGSMPSDFVQPLSLVGAVTLALGVGFVLSAGASYVISERLGLLEQSRRRAADAGMPSSPAQP